MKAGSAHTGPSSKTPGPVCNRGPVPRNDFSAGPLHKPHLRARVKEVCENGLYDPRHALCSGDAPIRGRKAAAALKPLPYPSCQASAKSYPRPKSRGRIEARSRRRRPRACSPTTRGRKAAAALKRAQPRGSRAHVATYPRPKSRGRIEAPMSGEAEPSASVAYPRPKSRGRIEANTVRVACTDDLGDPIRGRKAAAALKPNTPPSIFSVTFDYPRPKSRGRIEAPE